MPQTGRDTTFGRAGLAATLLLACLAVPSSAADESPDARAAVATIDGRPVTRGEFDLYCLSRRIPPDVQAKERRRLVDRLVERRLMQTFLDGRGAKVPADLIDDQVRRIHVLIRNSGGEPETVLKRLGLGDAELRREVGLPLAWKGYVGTIVSPEQVQKYFDKHRRRYDGTRIRARQILLKLAPDADATAVREAEQKLAGLRRDIAGGALKFEEAARTHSQAPSAAEGGDVGLFAFRGEMPESFARVAFGLKSGEMSQPFRSPFGMHLAQTTEIVPGSLSLEDVRSQVLGDLSEELWTALVEQQRAKSKIVLVE